MYSIMCCKIDSLIKRRMMWPWPAEIMMAIEAPLGLEHRQIIRWQMSAKYGKEIVANYSLLQLSFTLISQENCWDIQHTCNLDCRQNEDGKSKLDLVNK